MTLPEEGTNLVILEQVADITDDDICPNVIVNLSESDTYTIDSQDGCFLDGLAFTDESSADYWLAHNNVTAAMLEAAIEAWVNCQNPDWALQGDMLVAFCSDSLECEEAEGKCTGDVFANDADFKIEIVDIAATPVQLSPGGDWIIQITGTFGVLNDVKLVRDCQCDVS